MIKEEMGMGTNILTRVLPIVLAGLCLSTEGKAEEACRLFVLFRIPAPPMTGSLDRPTKSHRPKAGRRLAVT